MFTCVFCFLIPFTLISITQANGNSSCDKSIDRMDKIFKEALFIKQGIKFPSNDKEIDAYCRNGKLFSNEAKNFNNCAKPFPRQVVQILGKSLGRTMKSMCKPGKPRQDLAAAFECATTSYHKDLQDCGLILVNQIYLSSSNMTSDQLFPLICCSFHELVNCIRSAAVPSCTDEKFHLTNFFMGHINRLIKDLIDLLCGKWSTIEQCQLSAPEVFDHLAKLNNVSRFNSDESLLGTILNITAKLSSEDE
ncbi:uncharacterized protein LOC128396178 [Panonychus citri]|uniref:uncharacterized protein LOC128396178 n=1 Tax=Panonychus citri TaxID=50023 RepID=UPI0023079BD0|nr:uncharacterized protein LOC128396178 [Panonychus citri]